MLKPLQSVAIALCLFLSLTGMRPLTPSVGSSSSGPGSGDALTTNPLSQFASTTSNQLAMVVNNETGTGFLVFNDSPTIITPTIASFVNATHSHTNAAGGGQLGESALLLGANTTNDVSVTKHGFVPQLSNVATEFLNGVGTWTVPAGGGSGDALVANPLSQFAATTSAQLYGVLSDENKTGSAPKALFADGSINIASGKTPVFSNTLTFAGTDASTLNIGTGGTLGTVAYTAVAAAGGVQITAAALEIKLDGSSLSLSSSGIKVNAAKWINKATPTGTVNGSNATFTIASTPISGSEHVYLNGLLQEGGGEDYTLTTNSIVFVSAPPTGSRIRVTYMIA